MSRRALSHLLRAYLLRSSTHVTPTAAPLAALASNASAAANRCTWRDAWVSPQSSFAAHQLRQLSSESTDVARKRLLTAKHRKVKVPRPTHQTSAVAAPSATEPAAADTTQLQVQPSEAPATELQVRDLHQRRRVGCQLSPATLLADLPAPNPLLCLLTCASYLYRSQAWWTTPPSSSPGP